MLLDANLKATTDAANIMKTAGGYAPYDESDAQETITHLLNNVLDDVLKSDDWTASCASATGFLRVSYEWFEDIGPHFRLSIDVAEG